MFCQPSSDLLLKLLIDIQLFNLRVNSSEVKLSEHQELALQLLDVKCLHLVDHLLNRFKAQVLQDIRDLLKVLLNGLLLRLIDNSS